MREEVETFGGVEAELTKKLYALWYPSSDFFAQSTSYLPGPPIFIPEHHFYLLNAMDEPGHRTPALFDQRHLDFAYRMPTIWDGRQFPHYYNFLFLDLDSNGQRQLDILEKYFKDYDYLIYASGAEDHFHFILPHNLISSPNMRSGYLSFLTGSGVVYDNGVHFPTCAMALPGSRHPETGVRKALLKSNSGKKFWFDDASPAGMYTFGQSFFGRSA
jgi:hypothetical protein